MMEPDPSINSISLRAEAGAALQWKGLKRSAHQHYYEKFSLWYVFIVQAMFS